MRARLHNSEAHQSRMGIQFFHRGSSMHSGSRCCVGVSGPSALSSAFSSEPFSRTSCAAAACSPAACMPRSDPSDDQQLELHHAGCAQRQGGVYAGDRLSESPSSRQTTRLKRGDSLSLARKQLLPLQPKWVALCAM